jgi:hypothetical protein
VQTYEKNNYIKNIWGWEPIHKKIQSKKELKKTKVKKEDNK